VQRLQPDDQVQPAVEFEITEIEVVLVLLTLARKSELAESNPGPPPRNIAHLPLFSVTGRR